MSETSSALQDVIDDIVVANRILAAQGVVDAFGHVSARHPERPDRYLISRALAPELITHADIMEFSLDGKAADGDTRKPYLEKDIHGAIYEARPDLLSVIHNHSRSVIPFTVTSERLRPIVHSCATIGHHIPVWDAQDHFGDTNLLISSMEMGRDFARVLSGNSSALMRGHGCTVTGRSVREACIRRRLHGGECRAANAGDALRTGEVPYRGRGEDHLPAPGGRQAE